MIIVPIISGNGLAADHAMTLLINCLIIVIVLNILLIYYILIC